MNRVLAAAGIGAAIVGVVLVATGAPVRDAVEAAAAGALIAFAGIAAGRALGSVLWHEIAKAKAGEPQRPEDVRIVHADGTTTVCEVVYIGLVAGVHEWSAMTVFNPVAGDQIHVGMWPAHTSIVFPADVSIGDRP